MALTKNAQIAIGGGIVAIIVLAFVFLKGGKPGDDEKTVFLVDDPNGGCVIRDKVDPARVGDDKFMIWTIDSSGCRDNAEVVTVGNFRTEGAGEESDATHCRDAQNSTGGIWLFTQPESPVQPRQSRTQIRLRTKPRGQVAKGTYYYDICAGVNADKKSDPRLVIDY